METKKTFNTSHIILSFIGGFAIGSYIFGSRNNKIREKIEDEITNYTSDNKLIESIKEEEGKAIKENLVSLLEKVLTELKPEKTDEKIG